MSPDEVKSKASQAFDNAGGVHIDLESSGLPKGRDGVSRATGDGVRQEDVDPAREAVAEHAAHQQRLAQGGGEELVAARLPCLAAAILAEPVARARVDQRHQRGIMIERPVARERQREGGRRRSPRRCRSI